MSRLLAFLAVVSILLASTRASAGGLWLTDRGVVPMGRGFAMVAGADDPQALWYNPAGLTYSGQQLLFDASLTWLRGDFTRVDGGGNTLPTIDIDYSMLPIPMLGFSQPINEQITIGLGMVVPNAILLDYPYAVDADGDRCGSEDQTGCGPAPQRYSLYSMKGSALANLVGALAISPIEGLSIGIGGYIMAGTFQAEMAMSACDGAVCTQPENPEFDGLVRLTLFPVIEPGLTAGVTYDIGGKVRIGASVLWWFNALNGTADIDVRLPSASMFNGATIDGNKADVSVALPLTVRAGVEVRPIDGLRVEAAMVWERWSEQEYMKVAPRDVWIRDVIAIGDYEVGPINLPRMMNNVYSVRVGGEYALTPQLAVRAGYNWENSSFDDDYLTPLTLDAQKHILGLGASLQVATGIWLDVSYAHVFMDDPVVTNSQVFQPNAIRPDTGVLSSPVGNGAYNMEADMFGGGLRWEIDRFLAHRRGETPPPDDTIGAPMEQGLDRELREEPPEGIEPAPAPAPEPAAAPAPAPEPAPAPATSSRSTSSRSTSSSSASR